MTSHSMDPRGGAAADHGEKLELKASRGQKGQVNIVLTPDSTGHGLTMVSDNNCLLADDVSSMCHETSFDKLRRTL
jgi:hypothetical protein